MQRAFSLPASTMSPLLQKGNPLHKAQAPGQQHKSKLLQLHLVEAEPPPGWSTHAALKSMRAPKASGQQALPFPPLPCETPSGRAQPVTSMILLNSLPPGVQDIRTGEGSPQGWDAPCPKTTSGSHREQELPVPGGTRISHPTAVIGAVSSAGLSPAHCLHAVLPMSVPAGWCPPLTKRVYRVEP